MSVAYPQHETSDLTITWPDMRESFPCERRTRPNMGKVVCNGENPAEWVFRYVRCCDGAPVVKLYCTPCKSGLLAMRSVSCPTCGTVFKPPVSGYTSIEPLGIK